MAVLHLKWIANKKSKEALRSALVNLPTTLSDQYEEMLKRIEKQTDDPEDRDIANMVLNWICSAPRQMSLIEVQYSLAIEAPAWDVNTEKLYLESTLISLCAGFLVLRDDDKVVQRAGRQSVLPEDRIVEFVHSTAQDHIQKRLQSYPGTIRRMAEVCIGYLGNGKLDRPTCESDDDLMERLKLNRFLLYAACNWGHHLRLYEDHPESEVKKPEPGFLAKALRGLTTMILGSPKLPAPETPTGMALDMLGREEVLLNLSQLMHIPAYKQSGFSQRFPQRMTALHFAAGFGVVGLAQRLLEINSSKFLNVDEELRLENIVPDDSKANLATTTKDSGGKINYMDAKDTYMKTAMHVAARRGHAKIVDTLIEHGAKIEETTGDGETPLLSGAMNGDLRVVKVLLSKGADVHRKNKPGGTALHWASLNGNPKVIAELLKYGANVSEIADAEATVNYGIESIGFDAMVWLLLDRLASAGLQNLLGGTPLHWAAFNGRLEVVELLIENGADVHVKNAFGGTPLHAAAWNGNEYVVEELIKKNASISDKNALEVTPLREACLNGHATVANVLLRSGADAGVEPELIGDADDFDDKADLAETMAEKGLQIQEADTTQGERVLKAVVTHVARDKPLEAFFMQMKLQEAIEKRDDAEAWSALREMTAKGFEALTTLLSSIEQSPPH